MKATTEKSFNLSPFLFGDSSTPITIVWLCALTFVGVALIWFWTPYTFGRKQRKLEPLNFNAKEGEEQEAKTEGDDSHGWGYEDYEGSEPLSGQRVVKRIKKTALSECKSEHFTGSKYQPISIYLSNGKTTNNETCNCKDCKNRNKSEINNNFMRQGPSTCKINTNGIIKKDDESVSWATEWRVDDDPCDSDMMPKQTGRPIYRARIFTRSRNYDNEEVNDVKTANTGDNGMLNSLANSTASCKIVNSEDIANSYETTDVKGSKTVKTFNPFIPIPSKLTINRDNIDRSGNKSFFTCSKTMHPIKTSILINPLSSVERFNNENAQQSGSTFSMTKSSSNVKIVKAYKTFYPLNTVNRVNASNSIKTEGLYRVTNSPFNSTTANKVVNPLATMTASNSGKPLTAVNGPVFNGKPFKVDNSINIANNIQSSQINIKNVTKAVKNCKPKDSDDTLQAHDPFNTGSPNYSNVKTPKTEYLLASDSLTAPMDFLPANVNLCNDDTFNNPSAVYPEDNGYGEFAINEEEATKIEIPKFQDYLFDLRTILPVKISEVRKLGFYIKWDNGNANFFLKDPFNPLAFVYTEPKDLPQNLDNFNLQDNFPDGTNELHNNLTREIQYMSVEELQKVARSLQIPGFTAADLLRYRIRKIYQLQIDAMETRKACMNGWVPNYRRYQQMYPVPGKGWFDYVVVVDFECTCEDGTPPDFQNEIIQFPAVLIDTNKRMIIDEFNVYVKPTENPKLTAFCTNLTGITQETVNDAPTFPAALKMFNDWLKSHSLGDNDFTIVTDGPTDMGKFLLEQCQLSGIDYPAFARRWINIRKVFSSFYGIRWFNLKIMMNIIGMPFEGCHHNGADDARNIATIFLRLLHDGCLAFQNEQIVLDKSLQSSNQHNRSYNLNSVIPFNQYSSPNPYVIRFDEKGQIIEQGSTYFYLPEIFETLGNKENSVMSQSGCDSVKKKERKLFNVVTKLSENDTGSAQTNNYNSSASRS